MHFSADEKNMFYKMHLKTESYLENDLHDIIQEHFFENKSTCLLLFFMTKLKKQIKKEYKHFKDLKTSHFLSRERKNSSTVFKQKKKKTAEDK